MLLIINGQRNRADAAVLVQWPGHSMDGEHTISDTQMVLFSWLCVLQSFLFMEDISQWRVGFMVVLHMVCYLCGFGGVATLRNQGSEGQVFGKALAVFGLWQLKCESCAMRAHGSCCSGLSGIGRN